jgi:hypothetical protein
VSKELGKLPVMLMLPQLKRNIINSPRTRRTKLELPDGFKNLEVSFTTHQLSRNTVSSPKKKNKRKKEEMLSHTPHLNLTNKRKNPYKEFLKLSVFREFGKLPAMLIPLLLKRNITNNLRTRRTKLELPDGFKNLEVSFTTHQLGINITSNQNLSSKRKKKRKEKLFHIPHLNLINKRKNP